MQYSEDCVSLTKDSEGFRATVYRDSSGFSTIGYGHKIRPGEDFSAGLTEAESEQLLRSDLDEACAAVNRLANPPQGLWQGATDALTDFTFNEGQGRLASSTLLKLLNEGDIQGAADEFPRWIFASGTKELGLIRRRAREQALFLSGAPPTPSSDVPMPNGTGSPPQG